MKIRRVLLLVGALSSFAFFSQSAFAEGHSGGAEGGAYVRLEPVTVNLVRMEQFLQTAISIKGGSPEVAASVSAYMPAVRHALILLLSSQKSEDISTPAGKIKLMDTLKETINHAIGMEGKDGVTDVLFESFIIQ